MYYNWSVGEIFQWRGKFFEFFSCFFTAVYEILLFGKPHVCEQCFMLNINMFNKLEFVKQGKPKVRFISSLRF